MSPSFGDVWQRPGAESLLVSPFVSREGFWTPIQALHFCQQHVTVLPLLLPLGCVTIHFTGQQLCNHFFCSALRQVRFLRQSDVLSFAICLLLLMAFVQSLCQCFLLPTKPFWFKNFSFSMHRNNPYKLFCEFKSAERRTQEESRMGLLIWLVMHIDIHI